MGDEWLGQDKLYHFAVCLLIPLGTYAALQLSALLHAADACGGTGCCGASAAAAASAAARPRLALALSLGSGVLAGLAKEAGDALCVPRCGDASGKDLVADALGVLLASGVLGCRQARARVAGGGGYDEVGAAGVSDRWSGGARWRWWR